MHKHFPLWVLAALVVFIFTFNLVATYLHLFFLIWWLDIPVHILGGLWIALLSLVMYYRSHLVHRKDHSTAFAILVSLCVALLIGLLWEVYEFVIDRAMDARDLQLSDTLKDLCDDFLGGVIAAWIFVRNGYNKHI
jgi:hypothetical protein